MALCDVALCPLSSGSGSSLKIPDYLAHGKPVVTTDFGMRGFEALRPFVHVVERGAFAAKIEELLMAQSRDPNAMLSGCVVAREFVERNYSWTVLARPLLDSEFLSRP